MSYIKINIGGKKRGLKFNQYAVILMAQKSDLDNYVATAGYAMIYAGLMANCYVKGEHADFSFEDVCDWVDRIEEAVMIDVLAVFTETQAYKNLIEKGQKVEDITKKKLRKTALKT